jgi:hypothetical protein
MKNVLFVVLAIIPLAPNPSSLKNMTFIALSVMKISLLPNASSVTRLSHKEE